MFDHARFRHDLSVEFAFASPQSGVWHPNFENMARPRRVAELHCHDAEDKLQGESEGLFGEGQHFGGI